MTTFAAPDLCEAHEGSLATGTLRVLALVFRAFGRESTFAGPVSTHPRLWRGAGHTRVERMRNRHSRVRGAPTAQPKTGVGEQDVAVMLPGVTTRPGEWIYGDADGILVFTTKLT
jgi:regulator of ribonuclease activity A